MAPGRTHPEPEEYYLDPTTYVPNSRLPVLVYRGVLGSDPTPESIQAQIEPNKWLRGGQWKEYPTAHFHSVTHECYAVFRGSSTLLLGKSPLDHEVSKEGKRIGVEVNLCRGDIIILPAGVSHHSVDSEADYEYVGLYPEGSPHWDNNWCKAAEEETHEKAITARNVATPASDPIYGEDGFLPLIWNRASATREL